MITALGTVSCAKFPAIVQKSRGDLLAAVWGMSDVYAIKMFETSYLEKKLIDDLMWPINRRL